MTGSCQADELSSSLAEEQQEPDGEVSDDMLGPDETMEDQPLDLSVLY